VDDVNEWMHVHVFCMYSLVVCMFIVKPPKVSVEGVKERMNIANPIIA
jgi:hypothetical protein